LLGKEYFDGPPALMSALIRGRASMQNKVEEM
jgi:hypothetical protein